MIDEMNIIQRLVTLESVVADLQHRLAAAPSSSNWVEAITGSITDEAAFIEALEYGQQLRKTDRPPEVVNDQQ